MQVNHFGYPFAYKDRLQLLVPCAQRLRLALEQISSYVVTHQRACVLPPRLVAHDRSAEIERNPISASIVANVRLRSWLVNLAIGSLVPRVSR
jgi:hypothetical protein